MNASEIYIAPALPDRLFFACTILVNRLLDNHSRKQLAQYARKIIRVDLGSFSITWKISPDGSLLKHSHLATADVTFHISLSDIPAMLTESMAYRLKRVRIAGDAGLASALARMHLRLDVAHDLSHFVGDILAVRSVSAVNSGWKHFRQMQQALTHHVTEYLVEENPLLLARPALEAFSMELAQLRNEAEKLEKRITRLTQHSAQLLAPEAV